MPARVATSSTDGFSAISATMTNSTVASTRPITESWRPFRITSALMPSRATVAPIASPRGFRTNAPMMNDVA